MRDEWVGTRVGGVTGWAILCHGPMWELRLVIIDEFWPLDVALSECGGVRVVLVLEPSQGWVEMVTVWVWETVMEVGAAAIVLPW